MSIVTKCSKCSKTLCRCLRKPKTDLPSILEDVGTIQFAVETLKKQKMTQTKKQRKPKEINNPNPLNLKEGDYVYAYNECNDDYRYAKIIKLYESHIFAGKAYQELEIAWLNDDGTLDMEFTSTIPAVEAHPDVIKSAQTDLAIAQKWLDTLTKLLNEGKVSE